MMNQQTLLHMYFAFVLCFLSVQTVLAQATDNSIPPDSLTQSTAPIFPGCDGKKVEELESCFQENIIKHINLNFGYPKDAKDSNYQGKIIVRFVVDRSGNIGEIKVLKGICASLDQEAIRVISTLPLMRPAIYKDSPVGRQYVVPIVCRINESHPPQKKKKSNKKDIPHWK